MRERTQKSTLTAYISDDLTLCNTICRRNVCGKGLKSAESIAFFFEKKIKEKKKKNPPSKFLADKFWLKKRIKSE